LRHKLSVVSEKNVYDQRLQLSKEIKRPKSLSLRR